MIKTDAHKEYMKCTSNPRYYFFIILIEMTNMGMYLVAPVLVGLAGGVALLIAMYLISISVVNGDNLTKAERTLISAEIARLQKINSDPFAINENDYPKTVGAISSTNLDLIEMYVCSDLCPRYARVVLVYSEINEPKECASVKGTSLIDIAWHDYVGCAPFSCSDIDPQNGQEDLFRDHELFKVSVMRIYYAENTLALCQR